MNTGTPGGTGLPSQPGRSLATQDDRVRIRPGAHAVARWTAFLLTFAAAWWALDRLTTSPPRPATALGALAAAAAILAIGERFLLGQPWRRVPHVLGLGRPAWRACLLSAGVGGAVIASYAVGAALLGIDLQLRPNWPAVLIAVLLFHGLAEELVWRGFVFGHLRRTRTFWRAVGWSVPLIALTHIPILIGNDWVVALLAVVSAAVTCLPLAYLWERGGHTMWAPAILHGLIGTWQLWERTYPAEFSIVVVAVSILVPLSVFLFRGRPALSR